MRNISARASVSAALLGGVAIWVTASSRRSRLVALRWAIRLALRSTRASHGLAEFRDAVVASPLVVLLGRRTLLRFHQQPLLQHPLDGAVDGTGREADLALRAPLDVLQDRVAVAILLGDGHQDVEGRRQKRQKLVGARALFVHATDYIHIGYIVNGAIGEESRTSLRASSTRDKSLLRADQPPGSGFEDRRSRGRG